MADISRKRLTHLQSYELVKFLEDKLEDTTFEGANESQRTCVYKPGWSDDAVAEYFTKNRFECSNASVRYARKSHWGKLYLRGDDRPDREEEVADDPRFWPNQFNAMSHRVTLLETKVDDLLTVIEVMQAIVDSIQDRISTNQKDAGKPPLSPIKTGTYNYSNGSGD